jgi:hypothetical protein
MIDKIQIHGNFKYNNILTKRFLKKYYYSKGMTWIVKKLKVNETTVLRYLRILKLPIIKISTEGRKKKSRGMSRLRKNNIVKTWNKGKLLWEERPDIVLQMKKTLKGKRCNPKGEFKKGREAYFKGKFSRKNQICRHHIDLNTYNNHPDNLLFLLNCFHQSLHKRAYDYLVKTNQIKEYIKWFIKYFKPKIYKGYKNAK